MKSSSCFLAKSKVVALLAFVLAAFAGTALAQGVFVPTGSMSTRREYHTATLLRDGTVLVAGGRTGVGSSPDFSRRERRVKAGGEIQRRFLFP